MDFGEIICALQQNIAPRLENPSQINALVIQSPLSRGEFMPNIGNWNRLP
jgi:hypothetical protein